MVGLTDRLDMTIVVDCDVEPQTNQPTNQPCNNFIHSIFACVDLRPIHMDIIFTLKTVVIPECLL